MTSVSLVHISALVIKYGSMFQQLKLAKQRNLLPSLESVTQQWRKSVVPILSIDHCEDDAHLCAHAQKTIPLTPIQSFTR